MGFTAKSALWDISPLWRLATRRQEILDYYSWWIFFFFFFRGRWPGFTWLIFPSVVCGVEMLIGLFLLWQSLKQKALTFPVNTEYGFVKERELKNFLISFSRFIEGRNRNPISWCLVTGSYLIVNNIGKFTCSF